MKTKTKLQEMAEKDHKRLKELWDLFAPKGDEKTSYETDKGWRELYILRMVAITTGLANMMWLLAEKRGITRAQVEEAMDLGSVLGKQVFNEIQPAQGITDKLLDAVKAALSGIIGGDVKVEVGHLEVSGIEAYKLLVGCDEATARAAIDGPDGNPTGADPHNCESCRARRAIEAAMQRGARAPIVHDYSVRRDAPKGPRPAFHIHVPDNKDQPN